MVVGDEWVVESQTRRRQIRHCATRTAARCAPVSEVGTPHEEALPTAAAACFPAVSSCAHIPFIVARARGSFRRNWFIRVADSEVLGGNPAVEPPSHDLGRWVPDPIHQRLLVDQAMTPMNHRSLRRSRPRPPPCVGTCICERERSALANEDEAPRVQLLSRDTAGAIAIGCCADG